MLSDVMESLLTVGSILLSRYYMNNELFKMNNIKITYPYIYNCIDLFYCKDLQVFFLKL